MVLKTPKERPGLAQNKKLQKRYALFNTLVEEIKKRDLPEPIVATINTEIDALNAMSDTDASLTKKIRSAQLNMLRLLEKELKLVAKNHYRNMWFAIGIGAFGVPIGVAFGVSLGNMGLIGLGMPLGLVIGMAVGMAMDNKAKENGNQLDVDLNG